MSNENYFTIYEKGTLTEYTGSGGEVAIPSEIKIKTDVKI